MTGFNHNVGAVLLRAVGLPFAFATWAAVIGLAIVEARDEVGQRTDASGPAVSVCLASD